MTPKKYFDTNANPLDQGYVFVLLSDKTQKIYESYIKKAADTLGFRCESYLDLKSPGNILEDILGRIQKAEILIFDITGYNPNVMWELGVALTIKDEDKVIVVREDSKAMLPFNIYSHRVSYKYNPNNEDSLNKLRETLIDVMRDIHRVNIRDNPIKTHEVRKLLESAIKSLEAKEWIPAEVLFENMNSKEPENWYIFNQWGIMFLNKNEFESAITKFNQAIEYAKFEDEKAFVYIELAKLYQINRKHDEAEDWFRKAEKADNKNRELYLAWAEFHDELGDYFNAQTKINSVLGKLKEEDSDYKEFKLKHDYYNQKINNRSYRKSFNEYKRGISKTKPPQYTTRKQRYLKKENVMPYDISWDDLKKNFMGDIVEGTIEGVVEFGIFVKLSRNFSGLIHWKKLGSEFEKRFSMNQPVKVKLKSTSIDSKNGRKRIDLLLVE